MDKKLISLVIPVYNEAGNIRPLYELILQAITPLMHAETYTFNIIFVNDGSNDNSLHELQLLQQTSATPVIIIDLSRNFGKEIALTAGLDHATGDAAIVLDADLQDPPALIPTFIKYWEEGFDIVYGKRNDRLGEGFIKKITAFMFYRIMQALGSVHIPVDTGDFRLLNNKALDVLRNIREKHRYMKGIFAWVGFKQKAVEFSRPARLLGNTKWNYLKLVNLAIEGLTSFSLAPLKLATILGLLTSIAAFGYALVVIYKTLIFGEPVAGYPSLMVVILFMGGIQLLTLGIIGEYLGRTFDEVKCRPLYVIKDIIKPSDI